MTKDMYIGKLKIKKHEEEYVMRSIDTIPIIINDYENVEYGMEVSDFLWAVRDELSNYIPKLKRFAKTHTEEKCRIKTGTWCSAGHIYETTADVLNDYITNVLFATA